MAILSTYTDDTATSANDKYLTVDSGGTTKLTPASTLKSYVLANGNVGPSVINLGGATAIVAANEGTSTGFSADLATVGPSVTVTIGANGLALVAIKAFMISNTAGAQAYLGINVTGASTVAPSTSRSISTYGMSGFGGDHRSGTFLFTGLNAGSTTFTLKYGVGGAASANYQDRYISVIPL